MIKGIGAVRFQALLNHFGDARTAWEAHANDLQKAGLNDRLVENLIQLRSTISLEKVWEHIRSQGITVLTWEDEGYPRRLREIEQPPPVLYLRGQITPEDERSVAVVGTRHATSYGRRVAEEIAGALAHHGVTVISGLARGIDAIAHQAALNGGGRTLAVMGCGLDMVYPPEHRHLAERIIEQGALVSDYPPGTPPEGSNFPPRNRIISGLSMGVVIVEAGEKSGALITAAFAADQGREVFAVPGYITAPQSRGTNRLIRDGAHPLLEPRDILETLNLSMNIEQRAARTILPADAFEAQLFQILGDEPLHIDEIYARTNMPIEKVAATLTMMELKGMVRQVGGMNYIALRETELEYR